MCVCGCVWVGVCVVVVVVQTEGVCGGGARGGEGGGGGEREGMDVVLLRRFDAGAETALKMPHARH